MTPHGESITLSRAKKVLAPYTEAPEVCKLFEATFQDNFIIVFYIGGQMRTLVDAKGLRLSYTLAEAYAVLCEIGLRSFAVVRQPTPLEPRRYPKQDDEPIDPPHPPDRPSFADLDKMEASMVRLAATAGLNVRQIAQAMRSNTRRVSNLLELKY